MSNGAAEYADAVAAQRHALLVERRDEAATACDKARLHWRCSPPGSFTARFGQYRKAVMVLLDAETALRSHERAHPELMKAPHAR